MSDSVSLARSCPVEEQLHGAVVREAPPPPTGNHLALLHPCLRSVRLNLGENVRSQICAVAHPIKVHPIPVHYDLCPFCGGENLRLREIMLLFQISQW